MATNGSVLNFNLGVVGHIDSGKTSLAKTLSTTASTASFDKNPQSQERGITIDLGFSSFVVDFPEHLRSNSLNEAFENLQFTLVDCPGHASLIKTIIGGSQIIDMMLLVVDATKGMQTQTAECLVLGEITVPKMIVALNKIDMFPEEKRDAMVDRICRKIRKTMEKTKFFDISIVPVSAKPGGGEDDCASPLGIVALIETLTREAYLPRRDSKGPFMFAVDHCFSMRGQGTVLTGTILSGSITISDNIEIPAMKEIRKVKSIQMFRKPLDWAMQGDRVGICVTQFDPKLIERGVVCSPGALPVLHAAIASVQPICHYKGEVLTKAKFHISLGHETVMASCHFFGETAKDSEHVSEKGEYEFSWDEEYILLDKLGTNQNTMLPMASQSSKQFVLLRFERPVSVPYHCLVIGSKLDMDIHKNACRLAFHGQLLKGFEAKNYVETALPSLKIFKIKQKEGVIERKLDERSVIVKAMFKKETNIQSFVGLKVSLSTGEIGTVEGSFGQSGKIKIYISGGLSNVTLRILEKDKKKAKGKLADPAPGISETPQHEAIKVRLTFKRYVYDTKKRIIQM